jgi:hypothetical protein
MAHDTTILNGDIGVWWLSNNRTKMLDWLGGTNESYTMNELYSAMQTLQDEETTIDDGTAFFADTPVEYTIGKIDSNDNDPFYITFALMQRITGGSLRTSSWAHVNGSNTGIVIVKGTNVDMDSTDIGDDVSGGTDGVGTLLEIISDGTDEYLVIRPDDATTAKEFLQTSQTITSSPGGNTFTQGGAAQTTGDMIWANIYSIGTIDPNVHLYVYQGARGTVDASVRVYSVNSTTVDYWGNGHIDICVPIKEYDSSTWAVIDGGYLRVFGRKGGDLFASFEVANSTTSGGRNPVPLQTSLDLDAGYSSETLRGHGTQKISFSGAVASGPFVNGEIISGGTSNGRGILDLTNSTVTSGGELVYWPIATAADGGALTPLQSGETVTGVSGANVTTDGAPADDGPAQSTWFTNSVAPTLAIGNNTVDIDNDTTDEYYGLTIDCNQNPLTEVYQWLKYICGYGQGETDPVEQAFEDDLSQIDVYGEEYEGGTTYVTYTGGTTPDNIAEGEAVTQLTTGAKGIVVSHNTADDIVLIRSTRGEFESGYTIEADDDSSTWTGVTAANFAPKVAAPFGTFAGGTFFGARGVVLTDYVPADENSFILTDIQGESRQRPVTFTITVTNLSGNAVTETDADLVGVYKLTASAGDIDKTTAGHGMDCDGGETVGGTTLAVDAIPTDVPSSGRLILIDVDDANKEYVIGYASWDSATATFTLDSLTPANLTAGTNENTLVSTTTELDNLDRGDIIVNDTRGAVQYVTDVQAGSKTVNCAPDIANQVQGDTIHVNAVPDITVDTADIVYVPYMLRYALTSSEQVGIIYPGSEIFFRVKVRNTRETDLVNGPIKPYSSDGSTTGTNQSVPTVRTIDTIIS